MRVNFRVGAAAEKEWRTSSPLFGIRSETLETAGLVGNTTHCKNRLQNEMIHVNG